MLIENGTIITKVVENSNYLHLEVLDPGEGVLRDSMGVNVPGKYLSLSHLTEKDKEVIDFSLREGLEWIALSFVRDENDMQFLQQYLRERKHSLGIITRGPGICAKIEDSSGYRHLEKILSSFDRAEFDPMIMVARGDLFNEMGSVQLASAQQHIISLSHRYKIPVMVGTGILESMKHRPRPTRRKRRCLECPS